MSPVETNPAAIHSIVGQQLDDLVTQAELDSATAVLQTAIDDIVISSGGLTDNELIALSNTTAAANKLPYFNSGTTATTTDFTSTARQLLDDTSFGAMLSTLGFSAFVQSLIDDTDAATFRTSISAQGSDPQLDSLAALPSVANLTVFASLAGTTNTIPYFATPSTMSLLLVDATTTLGTSDTTIATQKAVKNYVDANVGTAPDASDASKGISKLSVAATTATSPIAVGDNDPRLASATTVAQGVVKLSVNATTVTTPITVGDNDPRVGPMSTTVRGTAKLSVSATTASLPVVVGDNDPRLTASATDMSTTVKGIATLSTAATTATAPIVVGDNDSRLAGLPVVDATTAAKGIIRLSVNATTATIPIAVGDNDPRLTTSSSAALTSIGGVTPAADSFPYYTSGTAASTTPLRAGTRSLLGLTGASDSLPYFTSSSAATTTAFTAIGRALVGQSTTANARTSLGLAIGTNVQAWDADLDTLATMGTTRASSLAGVSAFVQTLLDDTTDAVARGTLLADDFSNITIFGHSINYTGSLGSGRGMGHRIANALHTDPDWWAIALSPLSPNVPGLAGWDHVYRHTDGVPAFSTSSGFQQGGAMQNPQRDAAFVFHGINDVGLPATGGGGVHQYSDLLPFRHALRASISRLLMSNLFEEDHSTVNFDTTGSGWSARAGTTSVAGSVYNASGGFYQVNTVVNKVVTVAVTSAFEGGTVVFGFLSDTAGRGASFTIKEGATTLTTVDARTANAVYSGTSYWTPVVARCAVTAAGAHTLTVTPTAISTQCYFDAWWIESNDAPLVCVPKQYAVTGGGYTAEFQTQLNQSIVDVVAEFGSNVFTMETNDLIATSPTTVLNDAVHPNDRGHGLIASRAVDTFMSKNRTRDSHSKGAAYNPHITRKPIDSNRNRVQPNMADVVPLTLAKAAYSATTYTADLLRMTDGDFTPLALFDYGGMLDLTAVNKVDSITSTGALGDKISFHGSGYGMGMGLGSMSFYALSTAPIFTFRAAGATTRSYGSVYTWLGAAGPSNEEGIRFGSAGDARLYRSATSIISSDSSLLIQTSAATTGTAGLAVVSPTSISGHTAVRVNLGASAGAIHTAYRVEDLDVFDSVLAAHAAAADTQPIFRISGQGKHHWGPGGASAVDVTFYRNATGVLRTDGSVIVDTGLTVTGAATLSSTLSGTTATFANGVTVTGAATLSSTLSGTTASFANGVTITGALTTQGTIAATGQVTLTSATTGTAMSFIQPAGTNNNAVRINSNASVSLVCTGLRCDDFSALDSPLKVYGVSTDGQPKFSITGTVLSWGAGGATTQDTTLNRSAASVLTAGAQFVASDGIRTKVVAASVTDGSFAVTPASGTIAIDTSHTRIWVRVGNTWTSAALA